MIIEEMLLQRYQGVKNEDGVWVTPAFPKLIYVLEEDNITEDAPYWYLTELAAKCTARRMVPDYISEKKMRELKGDVYTCMGCRSFLTPDRFTDAGIGNIANARNYEPGKHKYYGRFNQGVVTINLPDVALSSGGNLDKFWKIFEERLELCHRALQCRHERLKGTLSDAAPILWQYGALARLKKGETIDKLLYGGYSTISLGYAGLYECVKYMTGKSHTDPDATPFALSIMQKMNDKCAEWKKAENIDYSLYGTPLESTTYKFAKCLQQPLRHHCGHHGQGLHHQQLPRPRDGADRRLQQAGIRGPVPAALPRRRHQLCGGAGHAEQHPRRAGGDEVHLRQHHVRRAEHQERLLPGLRLGRRDPDRGGRRQAHLEVPQVRQHGSGQDERRPPDLRLHRHPVLESGPDAGDPGPGSASVKKITPKQQASSAKMRPVFLW